MSAEPSELSQADQILAHLEAGGTLTQMEATVKFGCTRLAARIWDLRGRGIEVRERRVRVGLGKWVSEYSIAPKKVERLRRADGTLYAYACPHCGGVWTVYSSQPACYCGKGPDLLKAEGATEAGKEAADA